MDNKDTDSPFVVAKTPRPFEEACRALEAAIPQQGFGLLGQHDLGNTLRSKGIDFAEQCRIFEVCQPQQAAAVLANDIRLNMALPCRLSVYTDAGQTHIGMISPAAMLGGLSSDKALQAVAEEVEARTRAIIEAAATA